jgi:S-adenosylmethionine:tRNA ribosyltransferase-isomerase
VQASDFDFELPPELIAQRPLPQRSASRLLLVDPQSQPPGLRLADAGIRDLCGFLEPGDLLVFNDTRVIPARLHGHKPSGGAVEMLLERPLEGAGGVAGTVRSRPLRPGQVVHTAGGDLVVEGREHDLFRVRLPKPAVEFFSAHGDVPLPPYIERTPEADDLERYQSVLARVPGAVAAPTASLHFDAALLEALAARGVQRTTLTLHVGAGTFQPLRSERIEDHVMHARVGGGAAGFRLHRHRDGTRRAVARVIAVGTTAWCARSSRRHSLRPGVAHRSRPAPARPRIFITPGLPMARRRCADHQLPPAALDPDHAGVSALAGRGASVAAYAARRRAALPLLQLRRRDAVITATGCR